MGRRIEVELTSTRDDGSWTWRAAGAKQPRGELSGDLLYGGAKVGDVVKVEADFHLDGIEVVEVFPPKAKKERTDLLELKSRPVRDDELVTTQRVSRRDRGDRGRRGDRPGRGDRAGRGDRGGRGDRRGGSGRREPRPDRPQRPKPKRLRAKREHRDALLASVPEEHRPIVEQVVRDGMPGVRAAIDKQNTEAKEAGKPEVDAAPILAIAERNLAAARLAEWRDRADAALSTIDDLDLRDLRSVVVVGNDVARDDESRGLADQLKSALDERMEKDHNEWLSDLRTAVTDGRVVRALRLSSRPVKAGAPLPTELAGELSKQAAAALAADVDESRWAIVLDALAFSPVRGAVTPAGLPAEPGEELLDEVRRLSDRLPAIAGLFGIDPAQVPKKAKRRRSSRGKGQDRRPKSKKPSDSKAREPKAESAPEPPKQPVEPPEKAQPPAEPDASSDEAAEVAEVATESASEPAPEVEASAEASPEPSAEPAVESDTSADPEPETAAETDDSAEAAAEQPAEADAEAEPAAEPEATADPEPEAAVESDPEPEAAVESDPEPEAAVESEPVPEREATGPAGSQDSGDAPDPRVADDSGETESAADPEDSEEE